MGVITDMVNQYGATRASGLAQLQAAYTMEAQKRKMDAEDAQMVRTTQFRGGLTVGKPLAAADYMAAVQSGDMSMAQYAEAMKDLAVKPPNYNQAFNPDGTPNLPYQEYQKGLKEKPEKGPLGNINPSDFTPTSLAKFGTTGNMGDLVRQYPPTAASSLPNYRKPMTSLQETKYRGIMADDFQKVGQIGQAAEQVSDSVADINSSKGLESRVGYSGYLPAWTQGPDAKVAANRIETLKGKLTQMGKAIASSSGAIGPMAVQEWKIVADAVEALDPTSENFKEQITSIETQAKGVADRIRDKYEREYINDWEVYPQFHPSKIPKYVRPPKGGSLPTGAPTKPASGITTTKSGATTSGW